MSEPIKARTILKDGQRVHLTDGEYDGMQREAVANHYAKLRGRAESLLQEEAQSRAEQHVADWKTIPTIKAIRGATPATQWDTASAQQKAIDVVDAMEGALVPAVEKLANGELETLLESLEAGADDPFSATSLEGTADDPGPWPA